MKPHEFLLNGKLVSIQGVPPQTTLLDYLRDRGLTGAKEGCAEGECGACTVVTLAADGDGSAYKAVNSCLMFAPMAAGREVYTVEGLAHSGELAEVQKAMAEGGGSQCGYCTPGFVMSLFAEQYRKNRVGPCDPHELGGNLCRCTGYRSIRDAALSLGAAPEGAFRDRLKKPAPAVESLAFEGFSRPKTIEECLAIPDGKLIAGGTDLAVESNLRGRRWKHLVSLDAIEELREFSENGDRVVIGAGLPLNEIGVRWKSAPEAFHEWLTLFASPPLRNRATLGGNIATASPIGDSPPLLLALDAIVHLAAKNRRRTVPLASFFEGYRKTALAPGEILVAVEIPKPLPQFVRFYKVAKRRMDDISTVAAGMAMDWDSSGRVARARFAFGGVAATPLRIEIAESAAEGHRWNDAAVERVQAAIERVLQPITDHRGSADYRIAMAKSLIGKFLWEHREAAA